MSLPVPGTQGYERGIGRFVEASRALSFDEVCSDFLDFLPRLPSRVLDVGSGAGQNSAALSHMGHSVVAVEPMSSFRAAACNAYRDLPIIWINDSLPALSALEDSQLFDFVLVEAVWHHLDLGERTIALERIGSLLSPGGYFACSLRNGPAGLGTRVFPTDMESTIDQASNVGLECEFKKDDLPSMLPNKENVSWSRLVFRKPLDPD